MRHSTAKVALVALVLLVLGVQADEGEIVGGEEAAPHSIPWQVSLRRASDNFHFCGGSVLGPNHVVSAAHCTVIWDSPEEVVVVAGEHDRSVDEGTEQTVSVASLTVHENYGSPKSYENDIALWELAEPLEMNEFVAPVALPEQMQQSEGFCTVSGWGTLHSGGSCCPDVLMKVDVPVVDERTCKIEYPFSIVESMICAGEREGRTAARETPVAPWFATMLTGLVILVVLSVGALAVEVFGTQESTLKSVTLLTG